MSTWLTTYFTVRARAFSSFFTNFSGIISSFLIAGLLDRQSIFIKTRARIAFASIIFILIGTWIWASILQKQFYDAEEPPVMQSEGNANHFVSIGLNFGITILCIVPTWIVLSGLEHSHEITVTADEVSSTKDQDPDTKA
ncbi:hypothetical protein LB505_010105 [Fusarium chuoi]|nr:hypothetical protein LB505_010105 [Fusarium chuoi]